MESIIRRKKFEKNITQNIEHNKNIVRKHVKGLVLHSVKHQRREVRFDESNTKIELNLYLFVCVNKIKFKKKNYGGDNSHEIDIVYGSFDLFLL